MGDATKSGERIIASSGRETGVKHGIRRTLDSVGILGMTRRVRIAASDHLRLARFRRRYEPVLRNTARPGRPNALLLSGFPYCVEIDLLFLRGLAHAGYNPVVLSLFPEPHGAYYRLAGVRVYEWRDFLEGVNHHARARELVSGASDAADLLSLRFSGAPVGRIALSTAVRRLHRGSLDFSLAEHRDVLVEELGDSMAYAVASQRVMEQVRPAVAVFSDMVYKRRAEMFAHCIEGDAPVIRWQPAHRSNALVLTRYTRANRDAHPVAISDETWQALVALPWGEAERARLAEEVYSASARTDWYGEAGTQFGTRQLKAVELRQRLGIAAGRKVALICPHILWDAPLSWEAGLFKDYEHWLIETIRAACANTGVTWFIKIHPAHIGKQLKERYDGTPAEVQVIQTHFPALPSHVHVIGADSDISTSSLFDLIDYCVTIRGTVGIEAACRGIPVLTASAGRYSGRGFTVDSAAPDEYLEKLGRIETIPALTEAQRTLAERYAYGLFVARPWRLESATLEYHERFGLASNFARSTITIASPSAWKTARDIRAFAAWLTASATEDFLQEPPDIGGGVASP